MTFDTTCHRLVMLGVWEGVQVQQWSMVEEALQQLGSCLCANCSYGMFRLLVVSLCLMLLRSALAGSTRNHTAARMSVLASAAAETTQVRCLGLNCTFHRPWLTVMCYHLPLGSPPVSRAGGRGGG